jgi:hypothetical protein
MVWVLALSNLTWSKSFFTSACLSFVRVIMVFRRVPLVQLLHQVTMEHIQYSSTYCQVHVGSCSRVLSCQAISATASRGPDAGSAYLVT